MILAIWEDVIYFFREYILGGSILAIISISCYYAIILGKQKKFGLVQKNTYRKLIYFFVLVVYVYIILGITIFSRSEIVAREINLELFRTFQSDFMAKKQIFENILMFVPYAILLYVSNQHLRNGKLMLYIGASSSLFIETMQWVTMSGHFELDDIWLNTLGMLMGYGFCKGTHRLILKVNKRIV